MHGSRTLSSRRWCNHNLLMLSGEKRKSYDFGSSWTIPARTPIPVLTLAITFRRQSMFNGAFIVDKYSLIVKAIFLLSGYLVVLYLQLQLKGNTGKRILWNVNSPWEWSLYSTRPNHDIRSSRITFDTRLHVSYMAEKRLRSTKQD